jgi:acyl carrier protein
MPSDPAFERLQKVTSDVLGVHPRRVRRKADLRRDLRSDTANLFELVMAVEAHFQVSITRAELDEVRTVGDLYDLVIGKVGGESSQDGQSPASEPTRVRRRFFGRRGHGPG